MNKKQFKQYLENPSVLSSADSKKLSLLLDDYPYFQTARMLYVKGLKANNDDKYEQFLQLAAAYAINRSKLYDFLVEEEPEIVAETPQKEDTPIVQQEPAIEPQKEDAKEEQPEEVSIAEDETAKEAEPVAEEVQNEPIAQEQTETADTPDNAAEEEPVREIESKEAEEASDKAAGIGENAVELTANIEESEQQTESAEPEKEEMPAEVVASEKEPEVEEVRQEEPANEPTAEPAESLADQILRKYRAMQEQAQTAEAEQTVATPTDSVSKEQHSQEPVAESKLEQSESVVATLQEPAENKSPLSFSVIDFAPSEGLVAEPISEFPVTDNVQEEIFIEFTETIEDSDSRNIVGKEISAESEKIEATVQEVQQVEEPAAPEAHDWYERSEKKAEAHSMDLIDAFISLNYKTPIKTEADENQKGIDFTAQKELLKAGEEEHEYVTETMAKIYAKQRHFDKAIAIYEKLCLKFPQKSIYFADRIKELTELKK